MDRVGREKMHKKKTKNQKTDNEPPCSMCAHLGAAVAWEGGGEKKSIDLFRKRVGGCTQPAKTD